MANFFIFKTFKKNLVVKTVLDTLNFCGCMLYVAYSSTVSATILKNSTGSAVKYCSKHNRRERWRWNGNWPHDRKYFLSTWSTKNIEILEIRFISPSYCITVSVAEPEPAQEPPEPEPHQNFYPGAGSA
jgi:hypothetical protein